MSRSNQPDFQALLQILDQRCPPYLCRLIAIVPGRGAKPARRIPEAEIIARSGLSRSTVVRLSYSKSWANVPMATASRFAAACGVNLLGKNPLYRYFRSHSKGDCRYLWKNQRRALEALRAIK